MKKIYINKSDTVAVAVHKILSSHDDDIVIYIPKKSVVGGSIKNFKLIKREAYEVGKKITVESIDQDALDYASGAGIDVVDAVFSQSKGSVADIKPIKKSPGSKKSSLHVNRISRVSSIEDETNEADETTEDGNDKFITIHHHLSGSENQLEEYEDDNKDNEPSETDRSDYEEDNKVSFKVVVKKLVKTFLILCVVAFAIYAGLVILPKADISITLTKIPWSDSRNITASASITSVDVGLNTIPAELFRVSKNAVVNGSTSSVKHISQRASGKMMVYNTYSSASQVLFKNTRFATQDGKIYRSVGKVTIPGAKISDGKIVPSSFEISVVADEPGAEYNSGPVSRLTIPGFKGTSKFAGFYGELRDGIEGGFVGEAHIATNDDIKKAKDEATKIVSDALASEVSRVTPPGFKIVEGGTSSSITKEGVASDPDDKGIFTYGVMMEAKIAAFREDDLLSLAKANFSKTHEGDFNLRDQKIEYGAPTLDLGNNKIVIPTKITATLSRSFDADAFKKNIVGKSEGELKSAVFSIPGVQSVKAGLWPIWVRTVPRDISKIKISVD